MEGTTDSVRARAGRKTAAIAVAGALIAAVFLPARERAGSVVPTTALPEGAAA